MKDLKQLELELTKPSIALIEDIKKIEGDIMLLGIGGKMGVSMGKLAIAAIREAGMEKRVIGVSRFSDPKSKQELEEAGIETLL